MLCQQINRMDGGIPMKHTRKRIISILAAAAVTVCSLPQNAPLLLRPAVTAHAANKTYFYFEYSVSLDGSSTALAKYHGSDEKVEIPAAFEGLPVTAITIYAFKDCTQLTDITIPNSVTRFGDEVFSGCSALTKVNIPSGISIIPYGTFRDCKKLTQITLPKSVTVLDDFAFYGCTALESIQIPDHVEKIGNFTFKECETLSEVTLADGTVEIGEYAFSGCSQLKEITLPKSIENIEDTAFEDCPNLTIKGYAGSYAESYANEHDIPFESMGEAPETPVNDWAEKSVISKGTKEAELVVRVGDIDACNDENAVADHGYDPFTAKSQYAHGYPWLKDETDPAGTDRIFVGSQWNGEATDGYAANYAEYKKGSDKENAFGEGALSFTMEYDASEIKIENVILQLCIDDFQANSWNSSFTVTLNGKDAPFIAELLNHTDQTGPTAYIVSAMIPSGFFEDITSGKLTVVIDETTGVGDGYAIDFARLLINYDEQIFTGTFSGKTEPGATVRLLGTSTTVTASPDGTFTFSAIPGINAVRASKNGFAEKYDSGIVLSSGTEWKPELSLEEGEGSPDIDFSKFTETGKPLKGDYNGDKEITAADAVLLARFVAEDTALTEIQIEEIINHEPDYDDDGLVTSMDIAAILRKLGSGQSA